MRLIIDTSQVTFTVSKDAEPKTDQNKVQKVDRNTNLPMWSVQLVAMDAAGAEVINVTVASPQAPKVSSGQPVIPVELQAIPWAQNGKNGTAFRAAEFKPVPAGKSGPAAS